MKVVDPFFRLKKIEGYLDYSIYPSRYVNVVNLDKLEVNEVDSDFEIKTLGEAKHLTYTPVEIDFRWGGYDKSLWLRTSFNLKSEQLNESILLNIVPGPQADGESAAEGLVYVNDSAVQAIDVWHKEVVLNNSILKEHNEVYIKLWSGVIGVPEYRTFKRADLVFFDKKVDSFYFHAKTICQALHQLDSESLAHIKMIDILNTTFQYIDFLNMNSNEYYKSIYRASDYLSNQMKRFAELNELKPIINVVGHSHIDMAWLWRLRATKEKASRTFTTVLNLMEQFEEYKFMHSSPSLFEMLEEDYPEIYNRVKNKIDNKQFEINGGMWVESDTYIPAGESLVRQLLFGQRYIKELTGKYSETLWLPDVFGYSGDLPQLLTQAKINTFMTTKISWNQYNNLPHDTFYWKGNDGSRILTHMITTPCGDDAPFYTYNGAGNIFEVQGTWDNYADKEITDELISLYGHGDGGGGPMREMIMTYKHAQNLPGINRVNFSRADDYFKKLHKKVEEKKVTEYEGELYFEYHRGTMTSQAATKKNNKEIEYKIRQVEYLNIIARDLDSKLIYYTDKLKKMWKEILLLQFHDILPGTSIKQVYEDAAISYSNINKELDDLIKIFVGIINENMKTEKGYLIINPHSYNALQDISISTEKPCKVFIGKNEIPCSFVEGETLFSVELSPYEISNVRLENIELLKTQVENLTLENEFVVVKFDEKTGNIISYKDKQDNYEYVNTIFNKFELFEDKPMMYDAWDIDIYYKEKSYGSPKLVNSKVLVDDEYAKILLFEYEFNKSKFKQKVILRSNSRDVEFINEIDYHETQVLLKVYFDTTINTEYGRTQSQYGYSSRPTHRNSEQDFAKFEVSGHHYSELSNDTRGLSVLNDCKYGHEVINSKLGLTLIKSATNPDRHADQGIHEFRYAISSFNSGFNSSDLNKKARLFAYKPIIFKAKENNSSNIIINFSFENDKFIIDTIKKAEENDKYILRIFNPSEDNACEDRLICNKKIKKVEVTNLLEEVQNESRTSLLLNKFEVKTLLVDIGD